MTTPKRRRRRNKAKTNWIKEILLIIAMLWMIQALVIRAYHIPTASMEPTVLVGDRVVVNRFIYNLEFPGDVPVLGWEIPSIRLPGLRKPAPGDVMVLDHPNGSSMDLLKRCVAVEGQTVEVRDGNLYIDGAPAEEPYVRHLDRSAARRKGQVEPNPGLRKDIERTWHKERRGANWNRDYFGPITVPEDQIFVMGDNRDFSSDSRAWGCAPLDNVHGRAMVIYYSGDPALPLWRFISRTRWGRFGMPLA